MNGHTFSGLALATVVQHRPVAGAGSARGIPLRTPTSMTAPYCDVEPNRELTCESTSRYVPRRAASAATSALDSAPSLLSTCRMCVSIV